MNCPLCADGSIHVFESHGIAIRDCTNCAHRFANIGANETHVSINYGDEYFNGGGAGYSDYSEEAELLRARGRMYARKIADLAPAGKMLDVGAAAGYVMKGFEDEGWVSRGIEPNASMARLGTEQELNITVGSFESFETDELFDLVSMIQVAAHFYDPAAAFKKASNLLKDNGLLLIETWDRSSVSARLFGRNWHEYSPPTVLHWYTQDGLNKYLNQLGLTRVAGGRPSKKISGGHVRSLLKYRLGDNFLLKLIPERINFPYPAEDLFWALYQKRT